MDIKSSLKNFLEIPYDELEELNLKAKEKAKLGEPFGLFVCSLVDKVGYR